MSKVHNGDLLTAHPTREIQKSVHVVMSPLWEAVGLELCARLLDSTRWVQPPCSSQKRRISGSPCMNVGYVVPPTRIKCYAKFVHLRTVPLIPSSLDAAHRQTSLPSTLAETTPNGRFHIPEEGQGRRVRLCRSNFAFIIPLRVRRHCLPLPECPLPWTFFSSSHRLPHI